jgi:hypothetical protein
MHVAPGGQARSVDYRQLEGHPLILAASAARRAAGSSDRRAAGSSDRRKASADGELPPCPAASHENAWSAWRKLFWHRGRQDVDPAVVSS